MFHRTGAILRWLWYRGKRDYKTLVMDDFINLPLGVAFWVAILALPYKWIFFILLYVFFIISGTLNNK